MTADFAPVVGNLTPRFVKSPVFPHPSLGWGMKLTSALYNRSSDDNKVSVESDS